MSYTPLQSHCPECDETFGPEQVGLPCPNECGTRLLDAEEHLQHQWERQQEDWASEPPISLDEQHATAWRQKQDLRRGYGGA